jgi:hypothetical protein
MSSAVPASGPSGSGFPSVFVSGELTAGVAAAAVGCPLSWTGVAVVVGRPIWVGELLPLALSDGALVWTLVFGSWAELDRPDDEAAKDLDVSEGTPPGNVVLTRRNSPITATRPPTHWSVRARLVPARW